MIEICLRQIAESKHINKSQLSLRAQVGLGVVRRYWDNETTSIDLRVLDKLCAVLNCEPGDLIRRSYAANSC
jgi:putative transcriptional regulator